MKNGKAILVLILFVLFGIALEATYHKIGHCGIPSGSRNVAIVNSTLLVPDEQGLHIIDVSSPCNPIYLNCYATISNCIDFEVSNGIAYIANTDSGLLILDVSDPHSPQFLGSYDTPDCALHVSISDSIAYVADRNAGLQIVDVSDPSDPQLLGCYNSILAGETEVCDSLVFVTNYLDDVYVVNASEPEAPMLVNEIENLPEIDDICILDSIAYVAHSDTLFIYDYSDHSIFQLISTLEVPGWENHITVHEDKAYVSGGESGVHFVDISNISEPELIGSIQTPHVARNTCVSNNIAYIIDLYTGVEIYDISEPANPDIIGSLNNTYCAQSVQVKDDIAYITDETSYIHIDDIRNPFVPYALNYYGIFYEIRDFLLVDDIGFAITNNNLYIFNLEDLIYPELIGYIEIGSTNTSVHYSDSMVYVSSLFEGVKCIDVENLLNPVFVGEYDLPGRAYDLALVGDFVYVANSLYGLQIINVSNPSNPFLVSYPTATYTPNSVYSITKHENILYCAGNNDGLFIADISDPTDPVFYPNLTHHPDSRFATDPIVIDNTLIVEDRNWNEILTFDISNPTSPILTNCYSWNLSIKNWFYYDNLLVTANGYNGVTLLDTQGVTPVHQTAIVTSYNQIHNYPNPFNPTTTIAFSIAEESAVDVCVYNVKGQQIKELLHEDLGSGDHTITWDGNNADNKPVSSGVYFYKVVTSKATIMKKMLLLK